MKLCSLAYCCYDPLLRDQEPKVHVTSAISVLPHIQTNKKVKVTRETRKMFDIGVN